jgi:hypothetical protein
MANLQSSRICSFFKNSGASFIPECLHRESSNVFQAGSTMRRGRRLFCHCRRGPRFGSSRWPRLRRRDLRTPALRWPNSRRRTRADLHKFQKSPEINLQYSHNNSISFLRLVCLNTTLLKWTQFLLWQRILIQIMTVKISNIRTIITIIIITIAGNNTEAAFMLKH